MNILKKARAKGIATVLILCAQLGFSQGTWDATNEALPVLDATQNPTSDLIMHERSTTTTSHRVGIGTSAPTARLEVGGCLDPLDKATLLLLRPFCGIPTSGFNPGGGDPIAGEGGGGNPLPWSPPVNFTVLDPSQALNAITTPLSKPTILSRLQNDPTTNPQFPYRTNFIVDHLGYIGINMEKPRASLDIRTLEPINHPSLIIGRQVVGNASRTRHTHFVPWLGANGYNNISQNGDQGMFFTDGMGTDGANVAGSFVIAPWADNQISAIGGLRMDPMGNVELRGNLELKGDIRSTKVTVDAVWWPDFVFEPSYALRPLEEVRNYIATHKHLPDMPSEADVKTQGQNMGELQKLQQQKIEELTLYTIQQEEKLKAQATKIAEMEQKLDLLLNMKK